MIVYFRLLSVDVRLPRRGSEWAGLGAASAGIAVALLAGFVSPAQGAAPSTVEEPVYIPAGVADAAGTVGCLRTPEGGVEAVDLASGRSLWRSAAPARPLLIAGGRAFVLEARAPSGLRLAARDARDGRFSRIYDLAPLDLPSWASLTEALEGRQWTEFDVRATLERDTLEVNYDVTRRQVSGYAAPGVVSRIRGLALVSLGSGRVEARPGQWSSLPPLSEPAPPMPGARLVAVHARVPDATIVLGGPPPNVDGALVAGRRRYLFEMSRDTRTVIVHRWSVPDGEREPDLHLEHGWPTDAVWATLDRRHVLLRRASDQRWYDLYSLETGEPGGRLEGPADVAVVGPRVYWTTLERKGRLLLVAAEEGSGRRLWQRVVRRPEGPLPAPIP